MARRPICDDCREAGCEITRDGVGELGYWECQREEGYWHDVTSDPAANYQDGPCGDR
jgi:hypothetical protein